MIDYIMVHSMKELRENANKGYRFLHAFDITEILMVKDEDILLVQEDKSTSHTGNELRTNKEYPKQPIGERPKEVPTGKTRGTEEHREHTGVPNNSDSSVGGKSPETSVPKA